jgi:hypothetical protein
VRRTVASVLLVLSLLVTTMLLGTVANSGPTSSLPISITATSHRGESTGGAESFVHAGEGRELTGPHGHLRFAVASASGSRRQREPAPSGGARLAPV